MIPIKPMLAVLGDPFTAQGWIFEPKLDGTRCIAQVRGRIELQNRRLRIITGRYPELVKDLARLATNCVLDGEIAVFVRGRLDFAALEEREQQCNGLRIDYLSRAMPASYIAFDILYASGEILMDRPLAERKSILKEELQEGDLVSIADYMPEKGEAYYRAAVGIGLEGVVAKRLTSPYRPGIRSPDWIKIKKRLAADLVVGGYIPGKGSRERFFGGLILGAYDSGFLVYVGRVGSGFSDRELEEIAGAFEPSEEPPFSNPPRRRDARWLKPKLVVEVAALEVTPDRHLRAPVFLRIRDDKEPEECSMDQLEKLHS
jgi:DNA ligase D-like protein (predicted ligase)